MKKLNLLICLLITTFSCTQNVTNQTNNQVKVIENIENKSDSVVNTSRIIETEEENRTNIDINIKNSYNNLSFTILMTNTEYSFDISAEIVLNNKKYISENINDFSFAFGTNDLKVLDNGIIKTSDKETFVELLIVHKLTGVTYKKEISVISPETKDYRDKISSYPKGYYDRATFNGKVFDINEKPLDKFSVRYNTSLKEINELRKDYYIDDNFLSGALFNSDNEAYVFRNVHLGVNLIILANKYGYTTRFRKGLLKSGLSDPNLNVYDFSGIYALQNEPEINYLEINEKKISSSSNNDVFIQDKNESKNLKPTVTELSIKEQITNIGNTPSIKGIPNKSLEINMCFSEEIDKQSVEDNFRIQSQRNIEGYSEEYLKNKIPKEFYFEWYKKDLLEIYFTEQEIIDYGLKKDNYLINIPCTKITSNSNLINKLEGDEVRYLIDFKAPFQDLEGNKSIDRRYFRFSHSQINDFAVFSVMNGN